MAVSLVGNITYINQNSQTSAAQYANAQPRPEVLQEINKGDFERKLQEIAKTTPTQATSKVDKDGSNKQQQTSEQSQQDPFKKDEQKEYKEYYDGILNISV